MKLVICPDCGTTEYVSTVISNARGRFGVVGCYCGSPEDWREVGEDHLPLRALDREARLRLPISFDVPQLSGAHAGDRPENQDAPASFAPGGDAFAAACDLLGLRR